MTPTTRQIALRDIRNLIEYWKVRREECNVMVKTLLLDEKKMLRSEEEDVI
ncbi:hypothetical protein KAX97_05215 [candidate division WOR-3 bacterium]|nr:hypothetical protein [candidate division WOR-3 bacterium]